MAEPNRNSELSKLTREIVPTADLADLPRKREEIFEITTSALPDGTQNVPYTETTLETNEQIQQEEGAFQWDKIQGTLPPGLTLSTAGVISGTPTEIGLFEFTVQVVYDSMTKTKELSITIYE